MEPRNALKSLYTRLKTLTAEIKILNDDRKSIDNQLNQKQQKLESVQKQIKDLEHGGDLILSEHAMLRYIERTGLVDLKKIETEILTDKFKEQVALLGNGNYPVGELKAVVRGNTIVTFNA